jgi:tetratricopeptide (TPR) repeat protein
MFERSVEDLVSAGDAANRERRWADAERAYAAALDFDPKQKNIWIQYGHSLKEQGVGADPTGRVRFFRDAEAAYRHALALDDGAADTYLQLGHVLKLQNRVDEAISAYEVCRRLDPALKDAARELRALRGTAVRTMGRFAAPFAQLMAKLRREKPTASRLPAAADENSDMAPEGAGAESFEMKTRGRNAALSDADNLDIKALYLLLLGRLPEPKVINENRGRAFVELTRELLRSGEFRRLVLVPLLMGRVTRHEQLGQEDFEFVRGWVDARAGKAHDVESSWSELLSRYFGRQPLSGILSEVLVSMLQTGYEPVSGGELVGRLFGRDGISVQMLVDDKIAKDLTIPAGGQAGRDARDEISRFNVAIPIEAEEAANGHGHRIVVRDARTNLPVDQARFGARLVPQLEGVLVGSFTGLSGWVRRTRVSEHRVTIDLRDGEQVLCSTIADRPTGNPLAGDHGFELAVPPAVSSTAGIFLDGIPIALLTDNITVPARVLCGSWQVELGRSGVTVTEEIAPGYPPLPVGFTLDNIADGVCRHGPGYILEGMDELFARGDDPEPAISEALHYSAISRDHRLLSLLRDRWNWFIVSRPRLFEQLMILYLSVADLNAARQLMQVAQANGGEISISLASASAMLNFCANERERYQKLSGLDPFSPASCHRDALNSTYNSLVVAVTRERMWIEQLLNHIEKQ